MFEPITRFQHPTRKAIIDEEEVYGSDHPVGAVARAYMTGVIEGHIMRLIDEAGIDSECRISWPKEGGTMIRIEVSRPTPQEK